LLVNKNDEKELGRKAIRLSMAITELPILVFLGYIIGRSADREIEGIFFGVVIGLFLLILSIWPSLKSRR
jgi:hypothetical protein